VGDDPTAKSSTLPSASEAALSDAFLPVIFPADPQEVLDLGLHGIALSRASGLWVGMKVATNVADGSATIEVSPSRVRPTLPMVELDGRPYEHRPSARVIPPAVLELERTLHHARLEAARRYASENGLNAVTRRGPHDRVGIVAAGKTYLDVRQALAAMGLTDDELGGHGIRLLKVSVPFPLDPALVRDFARGLREVVVVEEKRPFLELFVKDALYGMSDGPVVVGRHDDEGRLLFPSTGELDPDVIAGALGARLLADHDVPSVRARLEAICAATEPDGAPLPPRTPYFCSGCPHNTSAVVPTGALVGGGIGCHAMVLYRSPEQVGEVIGLTQMGGEGAQWIGMAPFTGQHHFFQNLGDGTFMHSGSLAVRAAVAAGVNITFKLLYNSAVAMTGGQPATGALPVDRLTHALAAEGVRRIIVTTEDTGRYRAARLAPGTEVWDRRRLLEAQEALARVPGVTVLLHDQECAAEKRRKRKRGRLEDPPTRVIINERICEGCGDCGHKSDCLSVQPVETEFGRKTRIHQASCNKDYSCLEGDCPSFLTLVPATTNGKAGPSAAGELTAGDFPDPELQVSRHPFALRVTGIGGTGVVTISQVLGTAAFLDGLAVRGLDQTGLAQKGGPVVSDLKLAAAPIEVASKLAAGDCDLYLGCDLLVAAEARNLACTDPGRTVAVVSTSAVPTGAMVVDPAVSFPDPDTVLARIQRQARATVALDARRVAEALFGSDQYANMVLVGAAYQAGGLPLTAGAIESAVEINGVAVAANLQAFRRGRQAVCHPEALGGEVDRLRPPPAAPHPPDRRAAAIVASVGAPAGSELERLVRVRVPDLVGYQDARYARRYAALVGRVRRVEHERCPGRSELAEAVARSLHKLMAYKDEYEVARLALDPAVGAQVAAEFGPGATVAWQLHPPVLRALGLRRKLSLGSWFRPVLRLLATARRLRHTTLDPFGRTPVRQVERALVTEYEELVAEILAVLGPTNHSLAVELAGLPDMVRGYEQIKLDNVARYHQRMTELRPGLRR
jgi:indolepyruvate ferredoxin oxidoreductase